MSYSLRWDLNIHQIFWIDAWVDCNLEFSLKELSPQAQNEWRSIHKNEVLYLVSLGKEKDETTLSYMNEGFAKDNGISLVRGCFVSKFDKVSIIHIIY